MSNNDGTSLTDHARKVAEGLAALLPSCIAGVRIEPAADSLNIFLDNPHEPARPLWIQVEGHELTLDFGEAHEHYGGEPDQAQTERMVIRVAGIVSGRDLTASAWLQDRCLGGGFVAAAASADLQAGAAGLTDPAYAARWMAAEFPTADCIRVVGWFPWDTQDMPVSPA